MKQSQINFNIRFFIFFAKSNTMLKVVFFNILSLCCIIINAQSISKQIFITETNDTIEYKVFEHHKDSASDCIFIIPDEYRIFNRAESVFRDCAEKSNLKIFVSNYLDFTSQPKCQIQITGWLNHMIMLNKSNENKFYVSFIHDRTNLVNNYPYLYFNVKNYAKNIDNVFILTNMNNICDSLTDIHYY